jgi:hypothetical protein
MMSGREWDHLRVVVDGLVASGNHVVDGGFRPTQGGWECGLVRPLDPDVARVLTEADARASYEPDRDEIFCRHCWTVIYGGHAAELYRRSHDERVSPRSSASDGSLGK